MSLPSCSTPLGGDQAYRPSQTQAILARQPNGLCSRRQAKQLPRRLRPARRERRAIRAAFGLGVDLGPVGSFVQHWGQIIATASPEPVKPAVSTLVADVASAAALHPTTAGVTRLAVSCS